MIVLTVIAFVAAIHNSIGININYGSITGVDITSKNIVYDIDNAENLFEDYILKHKKQYKDEEEYQRRYEIFKKNLININEMNRRSSSQIYGVTKFADMTVEEFYKGYTGLANASLWSSKSYPKLMLDNIQAPDEFDWRKKNVVTPVKDQERCGSCWAFSAVGLTESQHAIKHGELFSLSEQELVDCWTEGGGCLTGSLPDLALTGASKMGGFMKSKDYPYTGNQGSCAFRKESVVVKLRGGRQLDMKEEEDLKKLVYSYGPVSIGIYAGMSIMSYKRNVFVPSNEDCPAREQPNHAVLVVGYGSENGTPYWIIKNSWGKMWGEEGYLRIIRGKKACKIMSYVATGDIN